MKSIKKMVEKRFIILSVLLVCSLLFSSVGFINAWNLGGNVYDTNGTALNDTNVTITSMYAPGGRSPDFYDENTTQTNSSGGFILTVDGTLNSSQRNYLVSLKHFNSTTNKIDFIGQSLPYFPNALFSSNLNPNFYLKPAGTINITAINSTGGMIRFNYQIKDSQLGYTIDNNWNAGGNGALEATVYLPLDKNYSIMLYPRSGGMPISYSWTNFSASQSYNLDSLSSYNATTKVLRKQFNTSVSMTRVTGYINGNSIGVPSWDNFTVIPMIMESGKFIFLQHSAMPYNMSSWSGESDEYNYSSGFYNITIPGPAESQTILLYVSASNNSAYYGSYKNISISYGQTGQYNFTMYGLLGSSMRNISMGSGFGSTQVLTKMMPLNLVNATDNQTLTMNPEAHVEVILDYSSINVSEFTVTDSVSGTAIFYLPILNISGTKEINVFSNNFAPKRLDKKTASQLLANNNISLSLFRPQSRDGEHSGAEIDFGMFKSNASCDVPSPSSNCYIGSPGTAASFNPITTIMGGGKISFRMSYGNISIHYVNVDMLASGPPDASFDSNRTDRITTSFQAAMKFGSQGPKIYDYVFVSIPYDERTLREFQPVNISIPLLYDENWNVIWNVTSNGTNPNALAGNYSHYAGKEAAWGNLTSPVSCTRGTITSSNQINETSPCYIDTASNKIWLRIPHFSGTEPQVEGGSSVSSYTADAGIDYMASTDTAGAYLNRNYILINVTSNITNFNNLTIYLYNSTRNLNISNSSTDPTLWVNISNLTNGIWYFNATAFNNSVAFNYTSTRNVTIDTVYPLIVNLTDYGSNNSVVNRNNIYLNINSSDTNFNNITIRLYNSSQSLINSSTATSTNNSINFTDLSDVIGIYYYDALVYDKAGNSNTTSLMRVILNASSPSLNFTTPSVTTTTATITIYSNKSTNFSLSFGSSASLGNNLSTNGSYSSNSSFLISGLSASTTYYYNITICDRANNCIVNGTNSFTTSAVDSAANTETPSGSGSRVSKWIKEIKLNDSNLSMNLGQTLKSLKKNYRLTFNVKGLGHSVGITNINSTTITIEVASTPQNATLTIGETKKFDVDADGYYDVSVTLDAIITSMASITVKTIAEKIVTNNNDDASNNANGGAGNDDLGAGSNEEGNNREINKSIMMIAIIVIIILVLILIIYLSIHRYKKNRYYLFGH